MDLSDKLCLFSYDMFWQFFELATHFRNNDEKIDFITYYLNEKAQNAILSANSSIPEIGNIYIKRNIYSQKKDWKKYQNFIEHHLNNDNEINKGCILLTDLVNSTARTNQIGDFNYYNNIIIKHNEIIQTTMQNNDGRIIKNLGDSYLAIFSNQYNALKACIETQLKLEKENEKRNEEEKINVRIALNYGDYTFKLIEQNSIDIFGTAVSYTGRMIENVGGGQIYVSKDFKEIYEKNDYKKHITKNLEWCKKHTNNLEEDIYIFDEYYKKKEIIYNNIKIKTVGLYSFKGFKKEQELFCIQHKNNLEMIEDVNNLTIDWIESSTKGECNLHLTARMNNLKEIIICTLKYIKKELIKELLLKINKRHFLLFIWTLEKEEIEKFIEKINDNNFNNELKEVSKEWNEITVNEYIDLFKDILNSIKLKDENFYNEMYSLCEDEFEQEGMFENNY